MTDVVHVSWAFQPDSREQARIPRYATCLDQETADQVQEGLEAIGYKGHVVTYVVDGGGC